MVRNPIIVVVMALESFKSLVIVSLGFGLLGMKTNEFSVQLCLVCLFIQNDKFALKKKVYPLIKSLQKCFCNLVVWSNQA